MLINEFSVKEYEILTNKQVQMVLEFFLDQQQTKQLIFFHICNLMFNYEIINRSPRGSGSQRKQTTKQHRPRS
jgi:hypothetical protein